MVLATPVRLNGYDFSVDKTLNMSLKGIKHLLNVRLVLKKIHPSETGIIIDKAHTILIAS